MSKRILAMLLALALIVGVFAACGDTPSSSSSGGNDSSSSQADDKQSEESKTDDSSSEDSSSETEKKDVSTGADDTTEFYEWDNYYYYDTWGLKTWGNDTVSKYISDKFNINIKFSKPDADPDSKLNLMLTGDEMPDSMYIPQGRVLNNVARANKLVDMETLMYPGNSLSEDMSPATIDLTRVDGVFYGIPNWFRSIATGGNYQWIVSTKAYEAADKPAFNTLEDLHKYMLKSKEIAGKAYSGMDMIPFGTYPSADGYYVWWPIFRSMGGRNIVQGYWTQEDGKIEFGLKNEMFRNAVKMANQWFNEGLYNADVFTDTPELWLEKITNGRLSLMWYDFSQDDTNNFRRIMQEKSAAAGADDSYEIVGDPFNADLKDFPMFPPTEEGIITYGDENTTGTGDVTVITTSAERPQRIFDVFSFMVSKEGSINMMYGAEGEGLWEGTDENGYPILKSNYGSLSSTEMDAAGAWLWACPANADWVDTIKFAVNDAQPEDSRNWTVTMQAHMCSYNEEAPIMGQKFISDAQANIAGEIDSQSDLGIALQAIRDEAKVRIPQAMMTKDEAEFNKIIDDLIAFADSNSIDEINARWQAVYDKNVETQGFDPYSPEYDLYKVGK